MKKEEVSIRKTFTLRDRKIKSNEELSFANGIKMLNSVFKTYGFSKIVKNKKIRKRVGGKQIDVSDYILKTDHPLMILKELDCSVLFDYIELDEKKPMRLLK